MTAYHETTSPKKINCAPERKQKIYHAAAQRLQGFATKHPGVRFDADTPAISLATKNLDEALASFIEGSCGRDAVIRAFDSYEQALLEASEICACVGASVDEVEAVARNQHVNNSEP